MYNNIMNNAPESNRRVHFQRRDLFPRGGEKYTLHDMLDMLYVDSELRRLIPEFKEEEMERWLKAIPEGEIRRIRGHVGETRFVVKKENGLYHIAIALAVENAVNDRKICSDADTVHEQFGRAYGGLGGNSYHTGRR